MPWIAAAVGAVGAVAGAAISSDSTRHASNQQKDATTAALDENGRQFDLTRSDYAPYRETGVRALGALESDINTPTTAADVLSDPGYQFGLSQGQQAIDRKQAAQGGRVSGGALKRASEYATSYATTGYGAAYQRRQDRLNRLAALAGIGQTATTGSALSGDRTAALNSGLITSQGDANAAASLARGNIWQNTGNQLGAVAARWASQPTTSSGANWNSGTGSTGSSGSWGGSGADPWYG